jgi:hypothetical protein
MIYCCSGSDFAKFWFKFRFGSRSDTENTSQFSKNKKKLDKILPFPCQKQLISQKFLWSFFSFLLDPDPNQVPESDRNAVQLRQNVPAPQHCIQIMIAFFFSRLKSPLPTHKSSSPSACLSSGGTRDIEEAKKLHILSSPFPS